VNKIGKKKTELGEPKRVFVVIYPDEVEAVGESTGIDNVTSRTVREHLGLSPFRSKKGVKGRIIAKLADMTEDDRKKLLEDLEEE